MTRTEPMLGHSVTGPPGGVPVVFIHAVGIDSWMWTAILRHLPGVRAITIDLPGHGDSREIAWKSLEDSAERVCAVVERTCPSGANLAALSLGSYVGLHALASRPALFDTALLSGIHAGGMPRRWLMRLVAFGMAPLAVRPGFARKTAAMFGVEDEDVDAFVRHATRTRAMAFGRATNDVVDFEMPIAAAAIRTRVLFVAGSKEHDLVLGSLDIFAGTLPHGSGSVVEGGGHGWPGSMPEVFARMLMAHVEGRHPPPSPRR